MNNNSIQTKPSKVQAAARQADGPLKTLLSRPDVFADAVNYALYKGRQVVHPKDLKEDKSGPYHFLYTKNRIHTVTSLFSWFRESTKHNEILFIDTIYGTTYIDKEKKHV